MGKSFLARLFWLFKANVIISCLAIGGGYMILPLMKKQFIDKAKACDFDELLEMYAIAQSAPGAIAINLSAITGYKLAKMPGAAGHQCLQLCRPQDCRFLRRCRRDVQLRFFRRGYLSRRVLFFLPAQKL